MEKLNKTQLIAKCKEFGLKGYSTKKKDELINMITNFTSDIDSNSDIDSVPEIVSNNDTDTNTDKKQLRFIDLFCGIGGFHQALHKLGAKCVLACDIDKDCREVYHNNYGIMPVNDVKQIDENNMPDFDILCGGFPCQAFSNGGKKSALKIIVVSYLTKLCELPKLNNLNLCFLKM